MGYINQERNLNFSISKAVASSIFIFGIISTVGIRDVDAQSIVPASDVTGTIVNDDSNSNQFKISGGTQAGNNLFHSFQQFSLNQNQVANFLSNPNIRNILGRITGGDASIINGLIQITGSKANLYLMNPAGIIFGNNASLNIPASFTATTANAIGFANNQWFNAFGTNNYANLIGTPHQFAFINNQSGSIFNAGNLAVLPGNNLVLLGNTIVNTGTITAPGGAVTIAAIPGEKLVRVSPLGSILSLDLPIPTKATLTGNPESINPLSLPALLTGGNVANATGVTVENGVVKLTSSDIVIPTNPGTTIISGRVSVANQAGLRTPNINILGDKIAVLGATIDASSNHNGGTILIGGDYLGQGKVPNAQITIVDANTQINADALVSGSGGRVIVWADDTTRFQGKITARGNGAANGGFVETSGARSLNIDYASVDANAKSGQPGTWLLDPGNITISNAATTIGTLPLFTPGNINSNVNANAISNTLNNGTSVTISTAGASAGFGDITLIDTITKTGTNAASLTLTGRRFNNPGTATINLVNGGNLTFNINQVNPEVNAPSTSIENAINAIGTMAVDPTINLGAGTYTGGTLINKSLTINGVDAANTIMSGANTSRIFFIDDATGFPNNLTVFLNNLTVANGNLDGNGAGILNNGNLTINNSIISDNSTTLSGGGIRNNGNLTLNNSIVSGNSASGDGGGILNYGNNLIVNNSTISGNSALFNGGGIANYGSATISNSTMSGNSATFGGGINNNDRGALNYAGANPNGLGVLIVSDSIITGNSAENGGGIDNYNNGTVTVNNSTISRNSAIRGGGISNIGTLTASNSTLNNNLASDGGGGIANGNPGILTLSNSTISRNSASLGGGIETTGVVKIINSTLTGNLAANGGGIAQNMSTISSMTISNSIVAGNAAASNPELFSNGGTFTSGGNNLVGQKNNAGGFPAIASDIILDGSIDTTLAPLGNYGGTTQTHALLPGSLAINAASATAPATDQRGIARVGTPDIGAFESRGFVITANAPQSTVVNTAFATPPSATVTSPFGEPVAGGIVTYAAPTTGASAIFTSNTVISNTAMIDAIGQVSIPTTANTIAGSYTISAGANGILIPASISLTNNPDTAVRFDLTGFPSPTRAGDSQAFTVTAFDTFNNLATNYTGTINFSSDDPQAVLPRQSNLNNGTGNFTGELRTAGVRSLSATDATRPILAGSQNNIIVNPAAPANIISISGNPQSTIVSTAFAIPLQVQVTDAFSNPIPNTNVSFIAPTTGAGANFSSANTVTTNNQGIATAPNLTANDIAGTYRIITNSDRISLTPFTLTNQPVFVPQPVPTINQPTITPQAIQPIITPQATQPTSTATQPQFALDWEKKPPEGLEVQSGENNSPILCVIRDRQRQRIDEYLGLPECRNLPLPELVEK